MVRKSLVAFTLTGALLVSACGHKAPPKPPEDKVEEKKTDKKEEKKIIKKQSPTVEPESK